MAQQLLFDLGFPQEDPTPLPPPPPPVPTPPPKAEKKPAPVLGLGRRRKRLRRAVLRWLERYDPPTAVGARVPTRLSRMKADIAAFWSRPKRNSGPGPSQLLVPFRTAIFQCYVQREDCWPDAVSTSELLPKLQELRERLEAIEEQIRTEEPELREGGALFDEYSDWRYEDSRNEEYHSLRGQLARTEQALFSGTHFERIRSAETADLLYLAVPEGLVTPEELHDGWGLLWMREDMSIDVVSEPHPRECTQACRLHLAQNIAAAATSSVLFQNGVRHRAKGGVVFVRPPRGHRRRQPGTVDD